MGRDSVAYLVGGFLFTGIALTAGEYGKVANPYARAILLQQIRERVFSLPTETVILPFYGPPSTVAAEEATLPMNFETDTEELL